MTIDYFRSLPEERKKELIVDAIKVAEREDEIAKYELFKIDNFYIEVSRSVTHRFRRIVNTYSLKDVPLVFVSAVYVKL